MAWYSDALHNGFAWSPPDRYDYSVPLVVGTVITSPVDGVVLPASNPGDGYDAVYGRQPWGGELDILSNIPDYGGQVVVDMIHFDTIDVVPGAQVKAGERIGTSGGQLSGGHWPVTNPKFSTGPHIGVGVRALTAWDSPTTSYDPARLIGDLVAGRLSSQPPAGGQFVVGPGGGKTTDATPSLPSWLSGLGDLGAWLSNPTRIIKVIAGGVLIAIAIVVLLLPVATDTAAKAVKVASPVAGIAASVASAGASRATKDLREKQSAEIDRLAANREKRKPPPDRDFVGRREGGRTRTYDAGPRGVAAPLPERGATAGSVTMPAEGTRRTGLAESLRPKRGQTSRGQTRQPRFSYVPHPDNPGYAAGQDVSMPMAQLPGEPLTSFRHRQKLAAETRRKNKREDWGRL